ncbi:MAG: hypothetical protein MR966_01240 [Lachnospiraceae bacterium]|nr:hypothetical protein [Lachnospiraceae bacterium]
MKRIIDSIRIIPTESVPGIDRININLKTLILTCEGTLPGSRSFGLDREFLDQSPQDAINLFAVVLEEKVSEFIPDITILNVEGDADSSGMLELTVYVGRRQ